MRSIMIIKVILAGVAIAGLINFIYLLNRYNVEQIDASLLTNLYQQHPLYFYSASLSLLILFGLITFQAINRKPTKLYQQFHDIDSTVLDMDKHLCMEFYKSAVQYRVKFGQKKYHRYIVKHFDFFYDYHNYALGWIDEVVGRCVGDGRGVATRVELPLKQASVYR